MIPPCNGGAAPPARPFSRPQVREALKGLRNTKPRPGIFAVPRRGGTSVISRNFLDTSRAASRNGALQRGAPGARVFRRIRRENGAGGGVFRKAAPFAQKIAFAGRRVVLYWASMRREGTVSLRKWRAAALLSCAVLAAACGTSSAAVPAALTGVDSFFDAPRGESFSGASVFADDGFAVAGGGAEVFEVRWWMNPGQVDKQGIVLLFSCTREDFPDRISDVSVPLSARHQGYQTTRVELPPDGGRVLAWRALLLQRGKPLSLLKSPDWSATP